MNDAPSRIHGSHHWAFERLLSAGLVPLTAAAFATSGSNFPILDDVLGVSLVMHSNIGVRPSPPFRLCFAGAAQADWTDTGLLVCMIRIAEYLRSRTLPFWGI